MAFSPANSWGVIMSPKQWQQCGRPQQNRLPRPRRGRIRRISQSSSDTVSLCLPEPRWRCRFWMGTSYYRGGTCEVRGGVRHPQPGAQICFLMLCHEFFSEYLLDCLEILLEDKDLEVPWSALMDLMELDKSVMLAGCADEVLLCLEQKFPGLHPFPIALSRELFAA